MDTFSVKDVQRVAGLSRSNVRTLVAAGFVKPQRGSNRRSLQFSFQDLIVLRTARALMNAAVPPKRIHRSLEELRRHLPNHLPLSGLQVSAVGDRVVVREGNAQWQAEDGQYLLALDVTRQEGQIRLIEREEAQAPRVGHTAEEWFAAGLDLEQSDPVAARQAYQRAVELDPTDIAAWINWGRLLHEAGVMQEAETVYRQALRHCDTDACLFFNLGVLLEDTHHIEAATEMYLRAVELEPQFADAHYNVARLCEILGKPQHAIRHYAQYRRLIISSRD